MSFRERSAWTSLLSYVAVYGFYFWRIVSAARTGNIDHIHYAALLVHLIVLLILIQIVLAIVIAVMKPGDAKEPRDELDKLIDFKATRVGYVILMTGTLTAAAALAIGLPAFYAANGLFLTMITAEVARNIAQIVQYRMAT